MHKKLEAELISLAHNILQMKNRDVDALKEKAQQLYERLSVLSFVDEYLNTTPNATETKEELISNIETAIANKPADVVEELVQTPEVVEVLDEEITPENDIEDILEEVVEEVTEDVVEVVEEVEKEEIELDIQTPSPKKELTIEEEFKDSVSADVTIDLFAKVEEKSRNIKPSLNDKLQTNIVVGLNDRIAFVKHLFDHSQADFNRVLSQLNSFKTEKEAKSFIKKMVKPDYDWTEKKEYEERFMELITRKFL